MEDIRIPEFYAGREIFITGGTGRNIITNHSNVLMLNNIMV